MAFITGTDPDEFGPFNEVEEDYGFGPGYVWQMKRRTNKTYRVTWPCNASGGESPPATYSVGGSTYTLRSSGPDRGYGKPQGLYTAVYWLEGTWAWV